MMENHPASNVVGVRLQRAVYSKTRIVTQAFTVKCD